MCRRSHRPRRHSTRAVSAGRSGRSIVARLRSAAAGYPHSVAAMAARSTSGACRSNEVATLSCIHINGQRHPALGPAAGIACSAMPYWLSQGARALWFSCHRGTASRSSSFHACSRTSCARRWAVVCTARCTSHMMVLGRAEWMTASYEGRIGAVRVEASDAMDVAALVEAFIAACD